MSKLRLRVACMTQRPVYVPEMDEASGLMKMNGLLQYQIDFLVASMKVDYECLVPEDTSFMGIGFESTPGNYTGALGMLRRNEADIMFGQFFTLPQLFPYFGFSTCFDSTSFNILSGPPNAVNENRNSIASSVGFDMWMYIIFSWIGISLVSVMLARLEVKAYSLLKASSETKFVGSFLSFYGLLFQRGFEFIPVSHGRRIMVASWLLLSVILMTELSSEIASKLTVMDVPVRIDRVEDVAKYPHIKPYVMKFIVLDKHLELSESKEIQAVWKQVLKHQSLREVEELFNPKYMDEIYEGKSIVIGHREGFLAYMITLDCSKKIRQFYMSKENVVALPLIITYRKNLERNLTELLNYSVLRYGETGFHFIIWRSTGRNMLPCLDDNFSRTTVASLTLKDVLELFQLLVVGLAISLLIFIHELIIFRLPKRDRRH